MARYLKKSKKIKGRQAKPRLYRRFFTLKKVLAFIVFLIFLVLKLFKFAFKKRWWIFFFLLISLIVYGFFGFFRELESLKDKSFARTLFIQSHDSQLESEVRKKIISLLSKKPPYSRDDFLTHLDDFLKKNTRIDEYWIRLGLDNALYVKFTLNYGAFILVNKRKNYLVSHNHKIIKSNISLNDFPHLIAIEIPNISVRKEGVYYETNRPLNLFWLQENALKISRYVKKNLTDYRMEKLTWEEDMGYSLNLEMKISDKDQVKIFLGQNRLTMKLERLSVILKDVKKRKIQPLFINIRNYDSPVLKIKNKKKNSSVK